MRHVGLFGRELPDEPKAVARALDVKVHAGVSLALHQPHHQRLLKLVVLCPHGAGLSGQGDHPLTVGAIANKLEATENSRAFGLEIRAKQHRP